MWSISNIDNTVALNKAQALELAKFKPYKSTISGYYDDDHEYKNEKEMLENLFESYKKGKYYLKFIEDHMEHMDYVWEIADKLKELKVKGDITFGSLEGDNNGSHWGYRFDGKGGMKKLTGVLTFVEEK